MARLDDLAAQVAWSGRAKDLEIIVLRHQIDRPALTEADRSGVGGGGEQNRVVELQLRRRCSACVTRDSPGDRLDVSEHAAGVPGREGSDEPRGAVELDAAVASGRGPGELAGVPFDEGFGFRCDVEIFVEAGVCLADLGVSELDE